MTIKLVKLIAKKKLIAETLEIEKKNLHSTHAQLG